jgi:two-component system, response regulator RegA
MSDEVRESVLRIANDNLGFVYPRDRDRNKHLMPKPATQTETNEIVTHRFGLSSKQALVVDDCRTFSQRLSHMFSGLGWNVRSSNDFGAGRTAMNQLPADIVISEIRIGKNWAFEFVKDLKENRPDCRVVIATAYPSVATAVKLTQLGIDAYLAKTTDARSIVDDIVIGKTSNEDLTVADLQWPSLDRAKWEYINQVYVASGTMSEAARRLGLDRRSLRRMLLKYPPRR